MSDSWVYLCAICNDNEFKSKTINQIVLKWTQNNASGYTLEYSNDSDNPQNWQTITVAENLNGGTERVTFDSVQARYVKLSKVEKAKTANSELYSLEVYGDELELPSYTDTSAQDGDNGTKDKESEKLSVVAVFWISVVGLIILVVAAVSLTAVIKNKKDSKKTQNKQ